MRRLWIHIGTPKTGSTAIQRYARAHQDYLSDHGIDFLVRGRLGSYNDLGVFLRGQKWRAAAEIGAGIRRRIARSPAECFVLTSEMFTGVDPARLRSALALEEPFETRIVGYFRRQDRYLESAYKQKLKTGRIAAGFQNYLDRFGTRGGEYLRIVDGWQAGFPEAEFLFRRFEPGALARGDVVHDFMALLGLDIEADANPPTGEIANPTPSIDVLDLMQIVAALPGVDARRVFRAMPVAELPRFAGRAMDNATARALLERFAQDNEALRQRFFPDDPALFSTDDLDGPEPEIAMPSFTDEQRAILRALLRAVVEVARAGR